jgi:hypothetical protein
MKYLIVILALVFSATSFAQATKPAPKAPEVKKEAPKKKNLGKKPTPKKKVTKPAEKVPK